VILYRKAALRVAEIWFDEEANGVQADVVRRMQHSTPVTEGRCTPFHTILLDLKDDPDRLLARMKRETRYEIRRAADKDGLTYEKWIAADAEPLAQFLSFYREAAVQGNLPKLGDLRLRKLREAGALSLSLVRGEAGDPLVWHAYYRAERRVRLLHSASLGRILGTAQASLLGRANRYLHWQDMLTFKAHGVQMYDFGGWYEGDSDPKRLSINKFKEGFGGEPVLNFNCLQGLNRFGKAAVWFYTRIRPSRLN
jgi:hypothetical protein